MKNLSTLVIAGAILLWPASAIGDEVNLTFGGDQYTAGQQAGIETDVSRDAFIAGYDVSITAPVQGDGHLAGFNVSTSSPVSGDIYAAGFSVNIAGGVGGDVTAMGNSVAVRGVAPIAGNARLAGQSVTIEAPVSGSALVTAQTLTLNSAIAGDFSFIGENLVFSPGAKVAGKLSIQAPKEIAVPAAVASADRVTFTQLVNPDYVGEAGRTAENVVRGFWPVFWAAVAWFVFLVLVGAALIALTPRAVHSLEVVSEKRPFRTFGLGILTFASTLGLVPVAALTLIGLLALPFVFLYIAIACSVAYLVGAYLVGVRIGNAFVRIDTNLKRLAMLAVSLVAAVLLGMVPVLGWLLTLLILSFGFGAFAVVVMVRWSAKDAERLAAAGEPMGRAPAAPAASPSQ